MTYQADDFTAIILKKLYFRKDITANTRECFSFKKIILTL